MIPIPCLSSGSETWDATVAYKIKIRAFVLAAWKSYEQYTDYSIMWDDPQWIFSRVESFLGVR